MSSKMSDQWLYRIYGQEFGPVSLDLVRTLVASGTIAPDDEVRAVSRSNWILACAATELRDSMKSASMVPDIERRVGRDEWFCRGYAGDYGPLALSDLIQLAAEGELQPDEEIKSKADDYWRQVNSIQRLVELLPFSDPPMKPKQISRILPHIDDSAMNRAEILPFPGLDQLDRETLHEPNGSDIEATPDACAVAKDSLVNGWAESGTVPFPMKLSSILSRNPIDAELNQDEWTGWIAGEEFGPVSYTELLMWAVTGRLSPTDFVRRGNEGQYVPAVNIPCLFTVRAAADSLSRHPAPPKIRIAEEPSEVAIPEQPEAVAPPAVNTTVGSTDAQPTSVEAGLFRAASSLQSLAQQFARKILRRTDS